MKFNHLRFSLIFIMAIIQSMVLSQPLIIGSQHCFGKSWGTLGQSIQAIQNGFMIGYTSVENSSGYYIAVARTDTAGNQFMGKTAWRYRGL